MIKKSARSVYTLPPLLDILKRWDSMKYVTDFLAGAKKCQETCQYFSVCGGGQASNKFFENRLVNTTETNFCRNAYQRLAEAVISEI
jgi:uncharacterized protein